MSTIVDTSRHVSGGHLKAHLDKIAQAEARSEALEVTPASMGVPAAMQAQDPSAHLRRHPLLNYLLSSDTGLRPASPAYQKFGISIIRPVNAEILKRIREDRLEITPKPLGQELPKSNSAGPAAALYSGNLIISHFNELMGHRLKLSQALPKDIVESPAFGALFDFSQSTSIEKNLSVLQKIAHETPSTAETLVPLQTLMEKILAKEEALAASRYVEATPLKVRGNAYEYAITAEGALYYRHAANGRYHYQDAYGNEFRLEDLAPETEDLKAFEADFEKTFQPLEVLSCTRTGKLFGADIDYYEKATGLTHTAGMQKLETLVPAKTKKPFLPSLGCFSSFQSVFNLLGTLAESLSQERNIPKANHGFEAHNPEHVKTTYPMTVVAHMGDRSHYFILQNEEDLNAVALVFSKNFPDLTLAHGDLLPDYAPAMNAVKAATIQGMQQHEIAAVKHRSTQKNIMYPALQVLDKGPTAKIKSLPLGQQLMMGTQASPKGFAKETLAPMVGTLAGALYCLYYLEDRGAAAPYLRELFTTPAYTEALPYFGENLFTALEESWQQPAACPSTLDQSKKKAMSTVFHTQASTSPALAHEQATLIEAQALFAKQR